MTVWMCWILIVECMMEIKSVCGNDRVIFTVPVHVKKIHHTRTIYRIVEKPVYVESGGVLRVLRPATGGEDVDGGNRNVTDISRETPDGSNKTAAEESRETGRAAERGDDRDDAATAVAESRPSRAGPGNGAASGTFSSRHRGADPVPGEKRPPFFVAEESSPAAFRRDRHYDRRAGPSAGHPKNPRDTVSVRGPPDAAAGVKRPDYAFRAAQASPAGNRAAFTGTAGRDEDGRNRYRDNGMAATARRHRGGETENRHSGAVRGCKGATRGRDEPGKPPVRGGKAGGRPRYRLALGGKKDDGDRHVENAFLLRGGDRDETSDDEFPSSAPPPPRVIVKNVYYTLDPVLPYR